MSATYGGPSPHLPVRPDWLALHAEAALEPELAIVDPHHHLWDHANNPYFHADVVADAAAGHKVLATVFVECGALYRKDGPPELASLGETEFVVRAAEASASGAFGPCRVAAGIVGNVNLMLGDAAGAVLDAHLALAPGHFKGVRNSSVNHPEPSARGSMLNAAPGMLADADFRRGIKALAARGLSFDAWMYHTQLDDLVDLARAFPDLPIVLNHVGGAIGIGPYAGRRDEVFRDWRVAIARVAQCPNVVVKLGGLGMRLFGFDFADRPAPPDSAALASAWAPYIEACIESFGVERAMFESNFPVDKGTCSYVVLWNAFKRIASAMSAAEKRALFAATAARVYRLEVPGIGA